MKNAIISHGTGGSPEISWFRWLENELTNKGPTVWVPALPNPQLPSLADSCQAELVLLPDQGHFNLEQSPDYTTFPPLLTLLEHRALASLV